MQSYNSQETTNLFCEKLTFVASRAYATEYDETADTSEVCKNWDTNNIN